MKRSVPPAAMHSQCSGVRKIFHKVQMPARIESEDLKRLQVMMIVQMLLTKNMNYNEIAAKLNMDRETVERRMIWAKKANILVDLENQMMNELVPSGMKAIKTAMEDGDAETALELFKCLGILKDPRVQKTQVQVQEEDELSKAILEAKEKRELLEGTVDGELIGGRTSLAGLLETTGIEQQVEFIGPTDEKAMDSGSDSAERKVNLAPTEEGTSEVAPGSSEGNKADVGPERKKVGRPRKVKTVEEKNDNT